MALDTFEMSGAIRKLQGRWPNEEGEERRVSWTMLSAMKRAALTRGEEAIRAAEIEPSTLRPEGEASWLRSVGERFMLMKTKSSSK